MMYSYLIKRKNDHGYFPGGWISAESKEDATNKLAAMFDAEPEQVELGFALTKEEWEADFKRQWQGD